MDLNFTEEIMYTLPFYLGPLFLLASINFFRKQKNYRLNDTLTNASIALGNLGLSFIFLLAVVAVYSLVYSEYKFFDLDQSDPLTYVLAFLLYDFLYYWNHRFHHMIGLFWADHLVHHTAENFNFGVSIRISYFTELTMWMTFIPMAFLGISLEVFLIASYAQIVWAFCIHTKWFKSTPIADKLLNTPSLHRVHHARNTKYIDKNFGGIFIIWDRLFGTYQTELNDNPVTFGVRESFPSFSPLIINSYYLKTIAKKIRLSSSLFEVVCSIFGPPVWLPKKANKSTFYSKTCKIDSKNFKAKDPYLSTKTKWTCFNRFICIIVVFCYLMMNFGALPVLPLIILSVLFFWLCHYNGIVFDGFKIGWTTEIITQILFISFLSWAITSKQPEYLILSTGILACLSLVNYLIYSNKKSQYEENNLDIQQQ
ncbi:sterol desaturase family protein [Pseudoalteromonas denitrificans]|uniref:Sterol desaturase/sphingolipid hydroxylase, fatty acid hydroxylase superfamily n=1 Tax=Pseudoalteromonas denitrificans DSM 6059 TaxID=1123010 RepID=A0A1I1G0P5_9GAMM|nr:sterol desaturase family protein [Pseudoalteromonas denitrificans]SFC05297.1 Sterol desaturase/sphingolipid hydroxylase, fatty acid hydroxylase superfamily [Pseudoalteromonas denitrificans DSM 6059]